MSEAAAPEGQAVVAAGGCRPCMLSYYFHPEYSGSAVQARSLSRHLRELGIQPIILSARLSESPREGFCDGLRVIRLPVLKHESLRLPSFWLSLAWCLVRERRAYTVIHAHGTLQHSIASIVGRLLGKRTILKVTMANCDLSFAGQGRLIGRVNRFFVRRFDAYIATTAAIQAEFSPQGLDVRKVRLIPNGVDTEVHRPLAPEARAALRSDLGLPDGPLVGTVGIVNRRKNVDGMLRVWREVAATGRAGTFVVVGPIPGGDHDPYYWELQDFVRAHDLKGRVLFLGRRADVSRCLQACDVFVFMSRQEGMPNAVLEAMSTGLPCVVSRGTGTEGLIVDGQNGFLREVDDTAGCAALLARLLDDPPSAARVGVEARHTVVERFSLRSVADRYAALYRELSRRPC